jgi:hypothetical protein
MFYISYIATNTQNDRNTNTNQKKSVFDEFIKLTDSHYENKNPQKQSAINVLGSVFLIVIVSIVIIIFFKNLESN